MSQPVSEWDHQLDNSQKKVAGAAPSDRLVVTAGPGTGKTRTLLARARYLIEVEEVERAGELSILSFSRSAVETVAHRSDHEIDLGRLPIRTLDSFAAVFLSAAGIDFSGKSFDSRISMAVELMEDETKAEAHLGGLKHILVDEAQDIVGIRASFVEGLLAFVSRSSDRGYTVFGDPAQAIYDFLLGNGVQHMGPSGLLTRLSSKSATAELENNYRMEPDVLAPLARRYGKAIRSEKAEPSSIWNGLNTAMGADAGWTDLEDAAEAVEFALKADWCTTLAVLCRSNAEVLEIGGILQAAGVDVAVNHRAIDRGAAPWLAAMFGEARFGKARIPEFDASIDRPWFSPPSELHRVLRHAGIMQNKGVDLKRLATLLRIRACPESLIVRRNAPVVVSTIHRAKGQEFDTVFAVQGRKPGSGDNVAEEARVLYVASTRPRMALAKCPEVVHPGPLHFARDKDRVMVCSWTKRQRPKRVEVRVTDSEADWNAEDRETFDSIQSRLRSNLMPGDPIELRLDTQTDEGFPIYSAWHVAADGSDALVAKTGESFGEFMNDYAKGRKPDLITGLVAEVPDTASMPTAAASEIDLGQHGLHLRARF